MPQAGEITLSDLAHCAGVTADRLRGRVWSERLQQHPPFSEHHAVEAAIVFALVRHGVSQKVVPRAWDIIRPEVRKLAFAGSDQIWIVVSPAGPEAAAVSGAATAAERAAELGPCWLVPVDSEITRARERFAKARALVERDQGQVRRLAPADASDRPAR